MMAMDMWDDISSWGAVACVCVAVLDWLGAGVGREGGVGGEGVLVAGEQGEGDGPDAAEGVEPLNERRMWTQAAIQTAHMHGNERVQVRPSRWIAN